MGEIVSWITQKKYNFKYILPHPAAWNRAGGGGGSRT